MRACTDMQEGKPGAGSRKSPEADGCIRALTLARRSEAYSSEERRARAKSNRIYLVAMRLGDTPVPIPNTMVKT